MGSSYKLFNVNANAKTGKNMKLNYLTAVLYLAPADLSGYNVCSMAHIAQCKDPCLNTAGRGKFNNVQLARVRKTRWFFEDRQGFMMQVVKDIERLIAQAEKLGKEPLVRMNGTSDIKWENVRFEYEGKETTLFQLFPKVQFYDYTKIANRTNNPDFPANYDLTFSYSGVEGYQKYVNRAIFNGIRVAVVFDKKETVRDMVDNGKEFLGMPVVDGDNTDVRHVEGRGVAVALYAKGKAKTDTSGFVVRSGTV